MATAQTAPHIAAAAEALFEHHTNRDLCYRESRERVVRAVLDSVGYAALVEERDRLHERIVTTDIDGRVVRYDKVAEAEAALDAVEQECARLHAERDDLEPRLVNGMLALLRRHCTCFASERHPSLEIQVATVVRAALDRGTS